MGDEYKLNFQGLNKFIEDFRYLTQRGGSPFIGVGGDGVLVSIVSILKNLIILALLIFVFYTLYIILFKGYPRWFLNIVMFKFFKKENIDRFIGDDMVLKQINYLLSAMRDCSGPYKTVAEIYGNNTRLYELMQTLDTQVKKYYGKDDDGSGISSNELKYQKALKEYYLFYYKIEDPAEITITPDPNKKNEQGIVEEKVYYSKFFQKVLDDLLIKKLISPKKEGSQTGNKGNDELLWEVYTKEGRPQKGAADSEQKGHGYFARISTLHKTIKAVAKELEVLSLAFAKMPVFSYIMLPETESTLDTVSLQISQNMNEIVNGNIYKNNPKTMSHEYSWCIAEVISYIADPTRYKSVVERLNSLDPYYNTDEIPSIRYYLNLPRATKGAIDMRSMVEKKILGRKFEKKEPGWADYGQDSSESRYPKPTTVEFLDFIRKHPIISHVYFTEGANVDVMYNNIMKCYVRFMTNCTNKISEPKLMLENLNSRGMMFKNFVNSVNMINLHLNTYRENITRILEDQTVNPKEFFKRLFGPYLDDILKRRMKTYFKKVFSKRNWNQSFNQFRVFWKKIGDLLKDIIKSIWKSFFTKSSVEKPQPVPE